MEGILLTQNSTFILGPIAKVLGFILNAIFNVVPNIGVAIIIFTVVIYLILLPLTYKQQKFSKLSAKMNPEVQAIQEKYKNKKDQESMARQNQELQEVYKKYGVSPTGSCLQLLIQMPILFALYRVIYNIPAYVDKVFNCLEPLAENIISTVGGISTISALETTTKNFPKYAANGNFTGDTALRSVVDVLNRASSAEWDAIGNIQGLDVNIFNTAREQFEHFNNFLGLNIS
ncbi:MAG: YidC/Oxa1 family membrane protein insertase, partial [Lachnospiraceae bacterium]|nr:YidC/Oxa1 family membrane protein insertase [Lachnospiraceae bacterium]